MSFIFKIVMFDTPFEKVFDNYISDNRDTYLSRFRILASRSLMCVSCFLGDADVASSRPGAARWQSGLKRRRSQVSNRVKVALSFALPRLRADRWRRRPDSGPGCTAPEKAPLPTPEKSFPLMRHATNTIGVVSEKNRKFFQWRSY